MKNPRVYKHNIIFDYPHGSEFRINFIPELHFDYCAVQGKELYSRRKDFILFMRWLGFAIRLFYRIDGSQIRTK